MHYLHINNGGFQIEYENGKLMLLYNYCENECGTFVDIKRDELLCLFKQLLKILNGNYENCKEEYEKNDKTYVFRSEVISQKIIVYPDLSQLMLFHKNGYISMGYDENVKNFFQKFLEHIENENENENN